MTTSQQLMLQFARKEYFANLSHTKFIGLQMVARAYVVVDEYGEDVNRIWDLLFLVPDMMTRQNTQK